VVRPGQRLITPPRHDESDRTSEPLYYARGVRVSSRSASLVVGALLGLAPATVALAEPEVIVYVRRSGEPIEATVTVTDDEGHAVSCETENGQCSLSGLASGRHLVVAVDRSGRRAESQPVVIPPDGKVSLFVAVP
jgi:hypothetical protein